MTGQVGVFDTKVIPSSNSSKQKKDLLKKSMLVTRRNKVNKRKIYIKDNVVPVV